MSKSKISQEEMARNNLIMRASSSDVICVTISPRPKTDLKKQLNKWLQLLHKLKLRFNLYPEIAISKTIEGHMIPRLHFHGIIYNTDKLNFIHDIEYLESLCFICIKPCNNYKGWLKYCLKEKKITCKTLGIKSINFLITNTETIAPSVRSILDYKSND